MTQFNGKKLKRAREEKGWSPSDLIFHAAQKGYKLSGPSLNAWEVGSRFPNSDKLAALSDVLGKEVSYFFDPIAQQKLYCGKKNAA